MKLHIKCRDKEYIITDPGKINRIVRYAHENDIEIKESFIGLPELQLSKPEPIMPKCRVEFHISE